MSAIPFRMTSLIRCSEGIQVRDEDGTVVGKSKVAGWNAISQVAVSRIATAFPCLTIPPLVLSQLEKTRLFAARPSLLIPANFGIPFGVERFYFITAFLLVCALAYVVLITISLMTALPCAIALFPQHGKLAVSGMEPEFQHLQRSNGKPVEVLTYNKGL